jgi:cytochrome P460
MSIKSWAAIGLAGVLAAGLGGMVLAAQSRAGLKVPGGLSFTEFKGYQTWQPVAVSQVPDGLKLISANPTMMAAYRSGLPAAGKLFPDGSKVVKIEWAPVAKTVPYPVNVPGALMSVSFIEKDLKRFPKTHGWAYAQFLYDPATKTLRPNGSGAECGYACHTGVAKQDYIFTAYPPR